MRTLLIVIVLLFGANILYSQEAKHNFRIGENDFLLDGKPFQIISGEMHFARIPKEYWHDRLKTAKEMGLNTICTYVFWNYHETEKGIYNFSGNADVAAFVKAAQEEGLWVIIRPSPYACAEWEFGGYPWWLQNEKNLKVRSRDSVFLDLSKKYIQAFAKELTPLQIDNGGPIIMLQVENEYGSYDSDKEYLAINKKMLRDAGFKVEFYTCDGPSQMPNGYLPGILPAVNGYDNIQGVKELINKYNEGHGPYFIAEWYPAWFDSWGENHHIVPVETYIETYKKVLEAGFSINIYMVHGGTTREFWNGANMPPFRPQTSSYDYDAPIDEAGNITPKYLAMQKVIYEHLKIPIPQNAKKNHKSIQIPSIIFNEYADITGNFSHTSFDLHPMTFEKIGQGYGFVLYENIIKEPTKAYLKIEKVRDYALIFVNGKRIAILDRRLNQDSVFVQIDEKNSVLQILVENMGRINYGEFLNDNLKGITHSVFLGNQELLDWKMYSLPFDKFPDFESADNKLFSMPVLKKASFELNEIGDTWLDLSSRGKGIVWLNGHNLGRYWNIGPTQTIYIPEPWLRIGKNELIIFDELKYDNYEIKSLEKPVLNEVRSLSVQLKPQISKNGKLMIQLKSSDAASEIYYTTDGKLPSKTSLKYSTAFSVEKSCNLKVIAINEQIFAEDFKEFKICPSLSTAGKVIYNTKYSKKYPGNSDSNFVDGMCASTNYKDGFWQAFEGNDLDVNLDLGSVKNVQNIRINFLKDVKSWIFLPVSVEIEVSQDGITYHSLNVNFNSDNSLKEEIKSETAVSQLMKSEKIRYIHIKAKNTGICPAEHIGKGSPAWLFADEIIVE